MTGLEKLLQIVSSEEGAAARGSIPNRRNNPGDLRHGPNAKHGIPDPLTGILIGPNDIGYYDTVELGMADAERQFQLDAGRGLDIFQFVSTYAPANENNTLSYLDFVCQQMSCKTSDLLSEVLERTY